MPININNTCKTQNRLDQKRNSSLNKIMKIQNVENKERISTEGKRPDNIQWQTYQNCAFSIDPLKPEGPGQMS